MHPRPAHARRAARRTAAAKSGRDMERLRIKLELMLRERISVLRARDGESVDWANDVMQALWQSLVAPLAAAWVPSLIDAALMQVMNDRETFAVPAFVLGIRVKTMDVRPLPAPSHAPPRLSPSLPPRPFAARSSVRSRRG